MKQSYQNVGIFEIVAPVGPDLALTSNIPDVELETGRLDRLDVESLRRADVRYILVGQMLQQGRFPGIVQSQQQYPQLFLGR